VTQQLKLPTARREKPTVLSKRNQAESENLELARIILADPKSEGLQREWAERELAKTERKTGELF